MPRRKKQFDAAFSGGILEGNPIEELAYAVWDEYHSVRFADKPNARKDGSGPWSSRYTKHYRKIAIFCYKHKIDPREYIRRAFNLAQMNRATTLPQDLANPRIQEQFLAERAEDAGDTPAEEWQYQVVAITQMRIIDPIFKSDEEVLQMINRSFEPWFRVLYITPFNENLFAEFGEMAWKSLQTNRPLREYLRTVARANMAELERRIARFGDDI